MKKIALLLACAMLCSTVFASCGIFDSNNDEDTKAEDIEIEDTEADTTEADTTEADTTAEEVPGDDTTAPEDKDTEVYAFGAITDGTYRNEWLGIEFVPSGDVAFVETDGYDMWAQDSVTGAGVFIMISQIPAEDIPLDGMYDLLTDMMVKALKNQLTDQMDRISYSEDYEVTFGTKSYVGFNYEMEMSGITMPGFALVHVSDGYIVAINATAGWEDDLAQLISCFNPEPDITLGDVIAGDDDASSYVPGDIAPTGYVSDWLGLEFVPTENMVMATEEEIYEAMGLGADLVGVDKNAVERAKISLSYEMMATDMTTGSNINIIAEKLALENITMEQYIAAFKAQAENFGDVSITFSEPSEYTLAGQSYTCIQMDTDFVGIPMKQLTLLRKVDDRMVCITITAMKEGDAQLFLSCFKAK